MSVVVTEDVGHVRVVRLNRPERKNALTSELGWRLVTALRDAAGDDSVRCIAVTGNGDAFCSGLDLADSGGDSVDSGLSDQAEASDHLGWLGRFLLTIRWDCDKPVIMGLNGVAAGAGASLALAGDIRIAADTARLHPGYLRAGTSPDGGMTWTLPEMVGHQEAMRFLLDNRMVGADELLERGFVVEVVPAAELETRLLEYCRHVAETLPPLAVRRAKHQIVRSPMVLDIAARLEEEIMKARAGFDTEDSREAVRAIMEKRAPNFQGR